MEQVKAIEYNELPVDEPEVEEDPADARILAIMNDVSSF
jgi:hypothetical protein